MSQIKKYQQDAIVNSTLELIVSNKDEVVYQLEGTAKYRKIKDAFDSIQDLKKQEKVLEKKISDETASLNDAVKEFNKDVLRSSPVYSLDYNSDSWRGEDRSLRFNVGIDAYSTTRQSIADKIYIAMLPKDAANDVSSIMAEIAEDFKLHFKLHLLGLD